VKQERVESNQSTKPDDGERREMTAHPRFAHIEECSGGSNIEQIVVFIGGKWD